MRMNVLKLFGEQQRTLECFIEKYCDLAEDHHLKNVFSDIYRQYDKKLALKIGFLVPRRPGAWHLGDNDRVRKHIHVRREFLHGMARTSTMASPKLSIKYIPPTR